MKKSGKTIEVKVERVISAAPKAVFDAWLDPEVPGTVWNAAESVILDAKENGLFYWHLEGTPHYGRFTEMNRPVRIRHTWMSPNTHGVESVVTVQFKEVKEGTQMTLVHSGLPDTEEARGHDRGWSYFMGLFLEQFGRKTGRKFRFEDAHPSRKK